MPIAGPTATPQGVNKLDESSSTASRARPVCTGLITSTTPWIDAKYYAATQVMDEARHVEVFARYLDEKMDGAYPRR